MKPWIVCAALRNRHTKRIICGPRHYDPTMRAQIDTDSFWVWKTAEQGFVDQLGHFYTRKEAWKVAAENNQISRLTEAQGTRKILKVKIDEELFSENLY